MTSAIQRANFSDLPQDTLERILSLFDDPKDLARIARTSKAFQAAVTTVVASCNDIPESGGRDFTPEKINATIRALVQHAISHNIQLSIPEYLIPMIQRAPVLDLTEIAGLKYVHLRALHAVLTVQQWNMIKISIGQLGSILGYAAEDNDLAAVRAISTSPQTRREILPRDYGYAFSAASERGHTAIVQVLLSPQTIGYISSGDWGRAISFAAANGHTETVQALLDSPRIEDLTEILSAMEDSYLKDALFFAAANGHTASVQALLDSPRVARVISRVISTFYDWQAIIDFAAANGHTASVQALLDSPQVARVISIETRDYYWTRALRLAAANGCTAIVQVFLNSSRAARLISTSHYWTEPLRLAATNGHTATVQAILAFLDAQPIPAVIIGVTVAYTEATTVEIAQTISDFMRKKGIRVPIVCCTIM